MQIYKAVYTHISTPTHIHKRSDTHVYTNTHIHMQRIIGRHKPSLKYAHTLSRAHIQALVHTHTPRQKYLGSKFAPCPSHAVLFALEKASLPPGKFSIFLISFSHILGAFHLPEYFCIRERKEIHCGFWSFVSGKKLFAVLNKC